MVLPEQHRKANLIYNVGVKPPHQCGTSCHQTAAEIAAAEQCKKCESRYELLYYNEQHFVSQFHQPGCPDIKVEHEVRSVDVKALASGEYVTQRNSLQEAFRCLHGCEIQLENQPGNLIVRHQIGCPEWSDTPLRPR